MSNGNCTIKAPPGCFSSCICQWIGRRTRSIIQRVKAAGYKSLRVTVDTSTLGKRTADRYLQAQEALAQNGQETVRDTAAENDFGPAFGGRPVPGYLDLGLNWEDLAWSSREWNGPIVLKGIQSVEDVKLAVQHGVRARCAYEQPRLSADSLCP